MLVEKSALSGAMVFMYTSTTDDVMIPASISTGSGLLRDCFWFSSDMIAILTNQHHSVFIVE